MDWGLIVIFAVVIPFILYGLVSDIINGDPIYAIVRVLLLVMVIGGLVRLFLHHCDASFFSIAC